MSISAENRDCLVVMIDLKTCLENNDVALAESVRDTVNAMEQSDVLANTINGAIPDSVLSHGAENADVCRILIEGISCIKSKEYKLKVLEASAVYSSGDSDKIGAWLGENALNSLDLTLEGDQFAYASMLIRMCFFAKRFDVMEEIRAKLEGVS